MKYLLLLMVFMTMFTPTVMAATDTPTPKETISPTEESKTTSLNKQINDLKDKIASTVASLKLVEKRGVVGTVTEVKDTQISLIDPQQKTRIIDIDEITKFSSPSAKSSFGISDITPGSVVSVLGLYNKQSRRLSGRFIETITKPVFITGVVTNIDEDDFTVSVLDANAVTTIIDIEKITKTNSYTAEDEITKSGYSKLNLGDRVSIIGYAQSGKKDRLTGLRILQLPEAPRNPKISYDYPDKDVTPTKTSKATPTP